VHRTGAQVYGAHQAAWDLPQAVVTVKRVARLHVCFC